MNDLKIYDKIVMADVVEHIEQEALEKLFEKMSHSLSATGALIVHTAPNYEYYEYTYPKMRQQAAALNIFLPKEPRSYYEQLMHINEQTPDKLRQALERYFPHVRVWTGQATDYNLQKSPEESQKDNCIFGYAAVGEGVLDRITA